jgi:uncharacterized damage-inducible protein DinB
MTDDLLESWRIHDRINRYLLAAIEPSSLGDRSASGGRTVGEQFAHIHNVRLMWLKSAAPAMLDRVEKLEKEAITRDALSSALERSGEVVEELLRQSLANGGRVKGFKPHAAAFFAYLVSHESHHRGQIVLSLKQSGHPLDRKVAFGLWEWGSR